MNNIKNTTLLLVSMSISACGNSGNSQPSLTDGSLPATVEKYKSFEQSGITSDPQIGTFELAEQGGRPGHEGMFPVTVSPLTASAAYVLIAHITGDLTSASYQLINATGTKLADVKLEPSGAPFTMAAPFIVPNESFYLQMTASAKNGKVAVWKSALPYDVVGLKVDLKLETALMKPGQVVPVTVNVAPTNQSGPYEISLTLPSGFTSDQTVWSATLSKGVNASFRANVTAPAGVMPYSIFVLSATATTLTGTKEKQHSQVKVFVE
jgi:hypothetical protein